MKKRICQFVWNEFTNDARVLRECTALVEGGYDVTLIAIDNPNNDDIKSYEIKDGFEIFRVRRYPSHYLFSRKIIMKLKKYKILIIPLAVLYLILTFKLPIAGMLITLYCILILNDFSRKMMLKAYVVLNMFDRGLKVKADLYHSNDLNTLPQGYICSRIKNKPLVYDSHEVQTSRTGYNTKIAKFFEGLFIDKVDKMIMTTQTRANFTKELYNIEKPVIVHNYPFFTGQESIKFKKDLHEICNIDKNEPILLYQGGIQAGRGLEKIVESIPMIKRGTVVFIGDGRIKPQIKQLVKDMNLEERVRFIDKVPVEDLKYYTASAYLGFQVLNNVCFNHYSALSNKLFEYIMSEIPVVACDFPEIKRVVTESEIGVSIDSSSPEDIAKGVNLLLEDTGLYNKFRENCKIAKQKYNWNNEKHKFIEIYDEILSENKVCEATQ